MSAICRCEEPRAPAEQFDARSVGQDATDGRFAEVEIWRCRDCGRPWLRYAVEYEAFTASGRWARGLIQEADAETLTADRAAGHIDRLPWYIRGGSLFGGEASRASGPMRWN